ncbi:DUF2271 domain-containing protein [Caulobacter vibrioides]|uniref:DUF2271 domain-containing protein n=2 Tax=Caulobacter vibrioides TaxID=155892 RepID=Q9A3Z0_CAUVC|nr:DUF2271 domain-containing protein [Caulobacter vibrioides]YP_002518529.1 FlgD-Ig family periplasmic protein [Caulobacter vibrioides NA1000]AAK25022.1 conserved hypothetical protein [Caulobacter vibrioides CB15]ACL96621.1 FlgD-Ig family periplasmic protein [Caulobacter vibrioides NA1000]ATC29892.1 DUF2271 domain-containing protein [Caulobacter vibrioides]QXZ51408.1 DUF2271 domain-containing protein [Caulobacter vibrioides]
MKRSISLLTFAGAAVGAPAMAADLNVTVEVPKLNVAEYHKPYVAIWIENPADSTAAGTLAVWYDAKNREDNGAKWLKDMRQWWRKAGREMSFPADGVSGATRAPGPHKLVFSGAKGALKSLKPGQYNLVVEAAREVGGHEAVRVPFAWGKPGKPASAKGSAELGAVTVSVK